MKSIYNTRFILILCVLFLNTFTLFAQTDSTTVINVAGNCEMCKKNIESAAKISGVSLAKWDIPTKKLSLTYNPEKVNLEKIKLQIANAGYDVENLHAPDEAYAKLHECCQYTREKLGEHGNDTLHNQTGNHHHDHIKNITGVVVEENSKGELTPIANVNVHWQNNPGSTVKSNENGVFKLPYSTQWEKIVVSYVGMKSDTIQVKHPEEIIMITAKGNTLTEVTITGRRKSNFIDRLSASRLEIITEKELFKAACCNLSESFETNASVDVVSSDAVTGSKQIQLLGLSGIYTQLTVENLPGPAGLALPLGLNSIAGSWIESIQISKGVGSVANGYESMAGQINVELKKPENMDKLFFNAYLNNMGRTDLNLNIAQKMNHHWSTAVLLHDNFMYNKHVNFSKNGFRDLPVGNFFSGINRWHYENGKGLIAQFGIKYLKDDRIGGQTDFDEKHDKGTTNSYGIGLNIERIEGFAKIGYVFPTNKHRSLGLQLSASNYNQKSYFGLKNYTGKQKNGYANLIFQDIIGSEKHKYRVGSTINYNDYDESLNNDAYLRKEVVSGAFAEYTFSPNDDVDFVLGLREDYNSLYGWFTTPRAQLRYMPTPGLTLRASTGRGQRTANIIVENTASLASNRILNIINSSHNKAAYGLKPEVSWNSGISADQSMKIFGREASASVEFYHTNFQDQVVVDYENPRVLNFYNLSGKSISNSLQTEFRFMPIAHLEARFAYRLLDVKTDFESGRKERPLIAKHRAFINLGYNHHSGWSIDYTLNIVGPKRIPSTAENPVEYQLPQKSETYTTMNAQISKSFGKNKQFTVYLGGENLTNFYQKNPIIAADQPFGTYFDTTLLWGPLTGRMLYTGVRYTILQ